MRRSALGAILILAACGPADSGLPEIVALSAEEARDYAPAPSPDGSQIAFWRPGEEGHSELWVAGADMANPRNLGVHNLFGSIPAIWSPDGEWLAAVAGMRNTADILTVRVSDGEIRWLVESPLVKLPVQFHPDGDRVVYAAFTVEGTVGGFTVSQSTQAVEPLIAGLTTPHYGLVSPDGSTVVLSRFDGGRSTIWAADAADGGNLRPLTTEGFEDLPDLGVNPFSRDGSQFVFVSRRTGKRDVWIASLADGATRQLTTEIQDDYGPAWSPDGQSVAFLSNRGRQTDVWVVPAAGGEAVRVTDTSDEESVASWMGVDGLSFTVGQSPGVLWTRSLADGSETRLTPDSLDASGFVLSSDRSRIAFLLDVPGAVTDLVVMSADGGAIQTVSRGAIHGLPRWSRDGARLAYTSDQAGSVDVWVAEPGSTTAPRQLTSWQGFEDVVGWTGDGRALYIRADHESRLGDLWMVPLDGSDPERLTTDGSIGFGAVSWAREARELLLSRLESGVQTLARRGSDGRLTPFTTPADGMVNSVVYSPTGDVVALSFLGGGSVTARVVRSDDRGVVAHLPPRAFPIAFSADGGRLLYLLPNGMGNRSDLGILHLATGDTTRVTATPDDESDGAFTADGNSVILRRAQSTRRVMRADVSGVLRASSP